MVEACSTHERCKKLHIQFQSENLKERERLEDLGVHGKIYVHDLKRNRVWTGLIWLRIVSSGGFL
jgi:hypothetical protein